MAITASGSTDWAKASKTVTTMIAPPEGFTVDDREAATTTTATMTVSWTELEGATAYTLKYKKSGESDWVTATIESDTPTTAKIIDLAAGTKYAFQLTATVGEDEVVTDVALHEKWTLDTAPGMFTAEAGSDSVTLKWAKVDDATEYVLQYRLTPEEPGTPWTNATEVTVAKDKTEFTVTDLAVKTGYSFRLMAKTEKGEDKEANETAWTADVEMSTLADAPTGLKVKEGTLKATSVTLEWPKVEGATSYKLRHRTGDGEWTEVDITNPGSDETLFKEISNLTAGTQYEFGLMATTSTGDTAWSSLKDVLTLLAAPTANTPTMTSTSVTLTWTAVKGETYSVQYKEKDAEEWTAWTSTPAVEDTTATATVTGLEAGKDYVFQLKVETATNYSDWGTNIEVTTMLAGPAGFKVTDETLAARSVTLEWEAVDDVTKYTLRYKKAGDENWEDPVEITDGDPLTKKIEGLTAGTEYVFELNATIGEDSEAVDTDVVTLNAWTLLATPVISKKTPTSNSVTLEWSKVTGATGYVLEYQVKTETPSEQWTTWTDDLGAEAVSATVEGLLAETEYSFRLKATNDNTESAWSDVADAKTLVAAPKDFKVSERTATSVKFGWTQVNTASGYTLEYKLKSAPPEAGWSKMTPGGTATEAMVTGLASGTAYVFRLNATVSGEDTAWTEIVEASTLVIAPTGLTSAEQTSDSIKLTWTVATGAEAYNIYRSTTQDGEYEKVGTTEDGEAVEYVDETVAADTVYYYKVASVFEDTQESTSTAAVKTHTATEATAVGSADGILITWTAQIEGAEYTVQRKLAGATGDYTDVAGGISGPGSYFDNNVEVGETYEYIVVTKVDTLESTSDMTSAKAGFVIPTEVAAEQQGLDNVHVQWKQDSNAVSYNVYQQVDGEWELVTNVARNATSSRNSITLEKVAQGSHTYAVTAVYGEELESDRSAGVSVTVAYPDEFDALQGDTIVVTALQDMFNNGADGIITLREAILYAGVDGRPTTITFHPSLLGKTLLLTEGALEVTKDVTIDGSKMNITIDGNGGAILVAEGAETTLIGLTLTGSNGAVNAIVNRGGTMNIIDSKVIGNSNSHATVHNVDDSSELIIVNSIVAGNSATQGVIVAEGKAVSTITNSLILGNKGNVLVASGETTINNSTIAGNTGYISLSGATAKLAVNNSILVRQSNSGTDWGEIICAAGVAEEAVTVNYSLISSMQESDAVKIGDGCKIGTQQAPIQGSGVFQTYANFTAWSATLWRGWNLRLAEESVAVNAGNNALVPEDVSEDMDGNSRISGGIVDMGAYESVIATVPLTFQARIGNVKLGWKEIPGATHYDVYRKIEDGQWEKIGTTENRSYIDQTLPAGVDVSYRVTGIFSGAQVDTQVITTRVAPKAPGVNVTNREGNVRLTWKEVNGATSYEVYRKVGNGEWELLKSTEELKYIDSTGPEGVDVQYYVRANAGDLYTDSDEVTGRAAAVANPPLSFQARIGNVKLGWGDIPGATHYDVYRKIENGQWEKIGTTEERSYIDQTLPAGVDVSYKVSGVLSGSQIDTKEITTKVVPKAPGVNVTNREGNVKLAWKEVSGATSYQVYRKVGNGEWELLKSTTALKYIDTTGPEGVEVTYRVRAIAGALHTDSDLATGTKLPEANLAPLYGDVLDSVMDEMFSA